MGKSITETFDDLNSVEVFQNADGKFSYAIKLHFGCDQHPNEVLDKLESILEESRQRFEGAKKPTMDINETISAGTLGNLTFVPVCDVKKGEKLRVSEVLFRGEAVLVSEAYMEKVYDDIIEELDKL